MNIEGGSLEFEALLNNEQLIGAISEAERRERFFFRNRCRKWKNWRCVWSNGRKYKDSKRCYRPTWKEVVNLEQQIDKIGPGEGQAKIIEQAKSAKQELEAEKKLWKYLNRKWQELMTPLTSRMKIFGFKEVIAELENQVKILMLKLGWLPVRPNRKWDNRRPK